jgi:hypothetical protein
MIADALGLSLTYLNRVFRQLTDNGLITLKGQMVIINDVDSLSALADFQRGYLKPMPVWQLKAAGSLAPAAA